MNNKIKNILVLLFVVSTLLLIIGSVSATNADELNGNLETSVFVDDDLSMNDVDSISNPDDKVSSHITTNDDETFSNDNYAEKDLKNLDSNTVVSNEKDATIISKDSEKKTLSANLLGSSNFCINLNNATSPVRKGYDVYFEVNVQHSEWSRYEPYTGKVYFQEWFDDSELQFVEFTPSENSNGNDWADCYDEPTFVEDENGKYLLIGFNAQNLPHNEIINFTVHFKALKEGRLNNTVIVKWNDTTNNQIVTNGLTSSVLVGEPGITIIKTPQEPVVDIGDDVYFDIYFENTGTLPYDSPYGMGSLIFNDWFDEGLEYVGYTVNPDKDGNMWEIQIDLNFVEDPEMYGDRLVGTFSLGWDWSTFTPYTWDPGESLNITVHFKATKPGRLENHAQMWWKWKPWGSNETHEWIEPWGNSSVLVGQPKFTLEKISNYERVNVGENASFTLIYTNTGNLNLTGVYIKDSEFTQGLKYLDYSDKELWTFDGKDTWYYNSILEPGDAITLEITFQATAAGEQNNTAVAGHNLTNETHNSTDTVLVVENDEDSVEDEDDIDDNESDDGDDLYDDEEEEGEEEETPEEQINKNPKGTPLKKVSLPVVGNPLFVLLLSLISLCFVPFRGKK